MASQSSTIHIVCGTDDNYFPHLAALLQSIHRTKGPEQIHVHGILDHVTEDNLAKIGEMDLDMTLSWYEAGNDPALELPPLLHISRATYLRLLADKVLPQDLDRVLYLDIDMIVTSSLLPLWKTDLTTSWCAAVEDAAFMDGSRPNPVETSIGSAKYFNAGMILFDLQNVREHDLFVDALRRLQDDPDAFEYADQDALNIVFEGHWTAVDPTWNFQRLFLAPKFPYPSSSARQQALPCIVHYTQEWKPWRANDWHPLRWLYLSALSKTPYDRSVRAAGGIGLMHRCRAWLSYQRFKRGNGLANTASSAHISTGHVS